MGAAALSRLPRLNPFSALRRWTWAPRRWWRMPRMGFCPFFAHFPNKPVNIHRIHSTHSIQHVEQSTITISQKILPIHRLFTKLSKSNFENNSSKTKSFSNSFDLNDSRETEFVNETFRYENFSLDSRLHISVKSKISQIDGRTSLKRTLNLDMHAHMQFNADWNRNYLELPKTTFSPFHQLKISRTEEMERESVYIYPSRAKQ